MHKLFLFLLLSFITFPTLANIKFVSASGASRVTVSTESETTGESIIYAGLAGTCASSDGVNTCNSCTQGNFTPCNMSNIYPSLILRMSFRTDTTSVNGSAVRFILKGASSSLTKIVTASANSDFTVDATWSEICPLLGSDGNCSTSTSGILSVALEAGLDLDNNSEPDSDNKVSVKFKINNLNSMSDSSAYSTLSGLCAEGSSSSVGQGGTANVGVCDYVLKPGDEKIFIKSFNVGTVSGGSLAPTFADFPHSNFLLFYNQASDSSDASKSAALNAINHNSEYRSFDLSSDGTDVTIGNDRATDFENDMTYCFLLANQNAAGNIFYFTPPTLFMTASQINNACVTPSQVVGLLDDKNCFIATAAFGSSVAGEVQTLRDFRNKFLVPYESGRKFVKWYYSWSPQAAEFISQNETLRTAISVLLWPLIVVAKVFLFLNFWPALLVTLLFLILLKSTWRSIQFSLLKSKKVSSRSKKF